MASVGDERWSRSIEPHFRANFVVALVLMSAGGAFISSYDVNNPTFHTILDTSVVLTGAMICLLLWDVSRRLEQPLPLFLAISFGGLAIGELFHTLAALGWVHTVGSFALSDVQWRAGTWGPPAHILAIGVGASLYFRRRSRSFGWPFAFGIGVVTTLLFATFLMLPRYTPPGIFGITRPTLVLVPAIWTVVAVAYYRHRDETQITRAIMFSAVLLAGANAFMLFSRAPHDAMAMVAHLGKFLGDGFLLFSLTQIGAADTARRILAEKRLNAANTALDARVQIRTADLQVANQRLVAEIASRRKSQELFEAFAENSPQVIYVKDPDGRYLLINRRFQEIFKIDSRAVLGKTDHELFGQEVADVFRATDLRVVKVNHPITEIEAVPHGDRIHRYLSVKAPLRSGDGSVYAIFGISTDITDLEQAKEALNESRERARLIIESALDAVVSTDSKGIVIGWTAQAEQTFGWSSEEAMGKSLSNLVLPERFRARHQAGLSRFLASGKSRLLNRRVEMVAQHRDGHEFPVELSITAIRTGGAVTFSGFVRDITEQKLGEAKVQTQIDRMRLLDQITRAASQRHDMQSIFQAVLRRLEGELPADFVCIATFDRVRNLLRVRNLSAGSLKIGRVMGIWEEAEIAVDDTILMRSVNGELTYEEDTTRLSGPFSQRLAGQGLRSYLLAPLAIERETFGVLLVSSLVSSAFTSMDCEFLKQLAEHIALAAKQAEMRRSLELAYEDIKQTQLQAMQQERLRALGQMASGIAHDINNAISPVAVYTKSLLEREPNLSERTRDYLETVDRVVKDVAATIARMRDFYRRDVADVELRPLCLNDVVPQVVDLTRARWKDMSLESGCVITVTMDLEDDLPLIMGNAPELREAIINLIFNAVDALPNGGTITIRTASFSRSSLAEGRVVLEVRDNGVGMDETTRRQCLEPFFTTKGDQGTGLGLAMVYGTIQRHNGTIRIDSAPRQGTVIGIAFAVTSGVQPHIEAKLNIASVPALRILLIDDDPSVLRSTEAVLEMDGHTITAAEGGADAIGALNAAKDRGEKFDVVITDLGMPYVDGDQVARSAKEFDPALPVVLLTGWGRGREGRNERHPHVDFTLPKPLDLDELRGIFVHSLKKRVVTE